MESSTWSGNEIDVVKNRLFLLLACLFVTMIGFGITLPVLPFYAERLALEGGVSRQAVAVHIGLLTSIYVLMQFFFAPLWGRWSDRVGRRPLILIGIVGYALAQLLFGIATSLKTLYAARILGGILSSATIPAATAYIADTTTEEERSRGMAWLGAAVSLGVVVGPSLGGVLARKDLHFTARFGHFAVDSFSVPFFAAALLALLTFPVAVRWLPESFPPNFSHERTAAGWRRFGGNLKGLLGLAIAGQFGLAVFETTFALYAQEKLNYGPADMAAVFTVCGLVMAVCQVGIAAYLAKRMNETQQMTAGFILMGVSMALLQLVRERALVLSVVAVLALGMAFITPSLLAAISKRGGQHKGEALGMQNAANSLGQSTGPLFGSLLFAWRAGAPFLLAGALLISVGVVLSLRAPVTSERGI